MIVSALNKTSVVLNSLLVVLCLVTGVLLTSYNQTPQTGLSPTIPLRVGDAKFNLEIADTPDERERGLSGRKSLAQDMGMLFVFDQPGPHCFWMKDTLIPLDIIWLNKQKQIVQVKYSAQPGSYPESYCPNQSVSSVVELNAGAVPRQLIIVGKSLDY